MDNPPMMVFDGECGFCHRAVQFVLSHEGRHDLLFVPRASKLGLALRAQHRLERVESLLWVEDGHAYVEWEAVARTARYVGGIYAALAAVSSLLPSGLMNLVYRGIARVRKRLGGAPRQCLLLNAEQQARFLG